jgi:hypothetical protein
VGLVATLQISVGLRVAALRIKAAIGKNNMTVRYTQVTFQGMDKPANWANALLRCDPEREDDDEIDIRLITAVMIFYTSRNFASRSGETTFDVYL